ncbi:Uncharacterised protein [Vibrio cholerae]|nr:Uncharacterised protein [Vibrio cholerae]
MPCVGLVTVHLLNQGAPLGAAKYRLDLLRSLACSGEIPLW